jgi:hypothetical protein
MLLTAIGPDFDNGLSLSGAGSCLQRRRQQRDEYAASYQHTLGY